jgi:hypothetical protein
MAEPKETEILEVGAQAASPHTPATFTEQCLQPLTEAHSEDLEIMIRVWLSRNLEQSLLYVPEPESVVLMGGRKRWLPIREQKGATLLPAFRHRFLLMPTKENVPATATASKRIPIRSHYVHP